MTIEIRLKKRAITTFGEAQTHSCLDGDCVSMEILTLSGPVAPRITTRLNDGSGNAETLNVSDKLQQITSPVLQTVGTVTSTSFETDTLLWTRRSKIAQQEKAK